MVTLDLYCYPDSQKLYDPKKFLVMAIKHVPRQTSHSVLICPPNEYVTAISGGHLIQCGGPNGLRERLTLGASGTPSVAGNAILLGTYAENGQYNRHGRRTALYSVQPACACASIPADWYLRIEEPPRTPVQDWFIPSK